MSTGIAEPSKCSARSPTTAGSDAPTVCSIRPAFKSKLCNEPISLVGIVLWRHIPIGRRILLSKGRLPVRMLTCRDLELQG